MRNIRTLLPLAIAGINGRNWYDHAGWEIDKVCRMADWCPRRFVGVLAVTSPRCSVVRNIRIALFAMHHNRLPTGIMGSIHASYNNFVQTGEINGQKTSAFYKALLGCNDSVVLDVWMAYALGVEQSTFTRQSGRVVANRRIRAVATELGITPAQCQASIWTGQRKASGYNYSGFNVFREYSDAVATNFNGITGISG